MASARGIKAGAAYVEMFLNDSRLMTGLKRAQARLRAFGGAVRNVGMRFTAFAAAAALPFIAGAKVFADFEEQMAKVSTMLDEPQKYMEQFKKGLRELSVEFGESTEALAGGLYDILSASIPAEKAMALLAIATKAAKAGMTDTKTSADAITTVLNAYGLSAEHAGDVSDLLFAIVKRGKTTFAQLAPAIGNVATIASSAGVSLEEMGAALAVMTRNGVQTDNAVTALNAIISSFLKPSSEAVEYAKELGFEMNSTTIQAEGLAGVFARISQLPPDAIARLFPNVRALKGILPALKNMEGFTYDMGVMGSRAGEAEKAYGKMSGTLMQSFRQLKQSVLVAFSAIGEAIAEPLARAAEFIKRWSGYIADFIKNNQALVVSIMKAVAIVGALGIALIVLGMAASALGKIFGLLAIAISVVTTAFSIMASVVAAILTPIGLVVTALASLAAYILYATGEGGRALSWLGERFGELKQDAVMAWQGIGDALAAGDISLAAKVLWLTIKMEWTRGINFLEKAWLNFRNFFIRIGYDAWHGLLAAVEIVWHGLEVGWIETTAFLSKTWTAFAGWVVNAWQWAGNKLQKLWNRLKGIFDSSFDAKSANAAADKFYEEQRDRAEKETGRKLADREARRLAERENAKATHEGTMAEIGRQNLDKHKELDDEYAKRMADNEAALAKARKEWEDSIAAAAKKRAAMQPELSISMGEPLTTAPVKISFDGIAATVEAAAKKAMNFDVVGTFSSDLASRMGFGSSVLDRTAAATEATAKYSKRMSETLDDLEFSFE